MERGREGVLVTSLIAEQNTQQPKLEEETFTSAHSLESFQFVARWLQGRMASQGETT